MPTLEVNLNSFGSTPAMKALHADDARVARDANIRGLIEKSPASWLGVRNRNNAAGVVATVIKRGDEPTTKRVERALREASALTVPLAKSIRPAFQVNRVTGQRYDLSRVLQGAPGQWSRWERARLEHGIKLVKIYLPTGGLSGLASEELAWAPVASIVLVDVLERAGYRCEVWGASHCTGIEEGQTHAIRFMLKEASDPLDVNAISRVAHPAFHRCFTMPLRAKAFGPNVVKHGYGRTVSVAPSLWGDADDLTIAMEHTYGPDEVLAEVRRALEAFTSNN